MVTIAMLERFIKLRHSARSPCSKFVTEPFVTDSLLAIALMALPRVSVLSYQCNRQLLGCKRNTTCMDISQRDASQDHTPAANVTILILNYDILHQIGGLTV